ncbi:DUF2817 domain-containing protein [Sphingomonas sp. CL5.1]|uniref:DUF2817 domain-containing protein n=2 Tax=Pseudomonadota TaxID=1224 RepID=UPI001582E139|nr:DUF2817 domain-containing protein [Sphingomonas sp. CL5.1]QKR98458.1 DUF2817 domain-containing protein [Sphingomonas sp. CL5.1]
MSKNLQVFNQTYLAARDNFLQATTGKAARIYSIEHPLSGPSGEPLHVDVAVFGSPQAANTVFLTSGVHGPELIAGSACQIDLVNGGKLAALPADVKVVLIHAINPWGSAHGRRYTEDNVDLCRNFTVFPTQTEVSERLIDLQEAIDSASLEPADVAGSDAIIERFIEENGLGAFINVALSGQYHFPSGIGFGGKEPAWSRSTIEQIITEEGRSARHVYMVDYHTGYGPYAHGCVVAMQTGSKLERAHEVFGDWILAPRARPTATTYETTGHTTDGYEAMLPDAEVIAGVLEIGTLPQPQLVAAMINEHRHTRHLASTPDDPRLKAARDAFKAFFAPDDPHWQNYVLHRGEQIFDQVLADISRRLPDRC